MVARSNCAAIITAAGGSVRMGAPKALASWRGVPLLQHQLSGLLGFGQRIVVLGAWRQQILATLCIDPSVKVIFNECWEESGRSGSLRLALKAVEEPVEAILVSGVDQPLDCEAIGALLDAMDPAVHSFAVPTYGDRRGHPIVFAAALLGDLRALPDGATLREIAGRFRDRSLEVPVNSVTVLANCNTPADLR